MTGLINTLSSRGYCCRETDKKLVSLTEKGEGLRQVYEDISSELRQRMWRGIPAEARDVCANRLEAILRNVQTEARE